MPLNKAFDFMMIFTLIINKSSVGKQKINSCVRMETEKLLIFIALFKVWVKTEMETLRTEFSYLQNVQ